ncbi:MAG: hypothetical protein LBH17_01980 [Oscillospiraceae bacterium]|jgi:alpha-tubulin suppressor-like RCC1 family protein|nr:hypothetical protein [Oscillospiraceae bacterium]
MRFVSYSARRRAGKLISAALALVLAVSLVFSLSPATATAEGGEESGGSLALGYRHGAAIASNGALWTWGGNDYGQLGDGKREDLLAPTAVFVGVVSVATGGDHTLALRVDGTLWAWGGNDYGQLGDGSRETRLYPVMIMDSVADISAGEGFSLAVKTDGTLWSWGAGYYGQVGDGKREDRLQPAKIMDDVLLASAGGRHGLAVKRDNTLWAWGCNDYGQLGDGTRITRLLPVHVLSDVLSTDAGGETSLAIKSDKTLWSWGENSSGQIGDGSRTTRLLPVKVMDSVTAAASGGAATVSFVSSVTSPAPSTAQPPVYLPFTTTEGHALALKTDGTLWSWGYNGYGQLGDGSRTTRLSPTRVMTDVREISAGSGASAAVKTDGTLWVWGHNLYGQVGDNTREDKLQPVKIMDEIKNEGLAPPTAVPSQQRIFINGTEFPMSAYIIGGANFLKVRDVAMALRDTPKRFAVDFDPAIMTVIVSTGEMYQPIGGELAPGAAPKSVSRATHLVSRDGHRVYPLGYAIDGANFYMLRDFMRMLDVHVTYSASTNSVLIDTSRGYAD